MSTVSRRQSVSIGPHASNADWDTASADLEYVPLDNDVVLPAPEYERIQRPHQNQGNTQYYSLRGRQMVDVPDLVVPVRGLSSGGAGDGVNSSTVGFDLDGVYDSLFGAAASTSEGFTTDGTDGGSGTTVSRATDTTDVSGNAFLIKGTTSGKYCAREVVSVSGVDMTIDRALTTDENVADTADESEVLYASKTWVINPAVTQHTHYYMSAENQVARTQFFGVMGNLSFAFPRGGYATANISGQRCTSWTTGNPTAPSVTFGTSGDYVKCWDMPFYVDGNLFMAYDLAFDCGTTFAPRDADQATNGHFGFVCTSKAPKLTGKIRARSTSSLSGVALELAQGTADTWRDDNTYDIGLQVGRAAGAAMYIRIPNMRFESLTLGSENGQDVWTFEGVATDRTADSLTGLARVHIF